MIAWSYDILLSIQMAFGYLKIGVYVWNTLHVQLSDINCVPMACQVDTTLQVLAMQQGDDLYLLFVKLDTICVSGGVIERKRQMSYST